jgi:tetratricopeptide (TPR) repeat protein
MGDRYKLFNYEITTDKNFMDVDFGITPDIHRLLESFYFKTAKGGGKIIKQLIGLIEQYPHVPHFKNYLMIAYCNSGNDNKAMEVNHWLIREHPDYLFGKLNLAAEYYAKKEYDKIPEVLGKLVEIKDLYSERKCFHLSEVTAFYKIAIMYFSAIGNIEAAESRYEILERLAPDHPDTKAALPYLMLARLEVGAERMREEGKTKIRVKVQNHIREVQTDTPPEFIHEEINWLYEIGLEIGEEKLKQILSLPYESLVSDLINVLRDSIRRYEYYKKISAEDGFDEEKRSSALHAFYLLGELHSQESLPTILETLSQGEDFLDFWYGDHLTGNLWEPLYYISDAQIEVLKDFVLSPNIYTYARSVASCCVSQIGLHRPDKREEVIEWFRNVFSQLSDASLKDDIIDSDFIGLAVCDALDLRSPELMPGIKRLYDLGYVSKVICGTFDEVEQDMFKPGETYFRRELLNIYDRYKQITTTWYGYNKEDELSGSGKEPIRVEEKIGRNDPCPCGSGKKYKKCCLNK